MNDPTLKPRTPLSKAYACLLLSGVSCAILMTLLPCFYLLFLHRLARRGRTIILSIHQPRFSIYRLFDTLTLLSLGKLAYHGSYDEVLPYFEAQGYYVLYYASQCDIYKCIDYFVSLHLFLRSATCSER